MTFKTLFQHTPLEVESECSTLLRDTLKTNYFNLCLSQSHCINRGNGLTGDWKIKDSFNILHIGYFTSGYAFACPKPIIKRGMVTSSETPGKE